MTEIRKPPVRIKDIAKVLNMPVSTVGNILRGNPNYAEDLRRQVMESAEKLGYRRNILASGLRGGGTNTVGVLWSLGSKQVAADLIRELSYQCFARGHTTLVSDSRSDVDISMEVLAGFMDRRVDNVVFQWRNGTGQIPEPILEKLLGFPNVVLVQGRNAEYSLKTVIVSIEEGIGQMVDYWVKCGRSKPAIMLSKKENMHKVKAFVDAFANHGIKIGDESILDIHNDGSRRSEKYYDFIVQHFFKEHFAYDSLFCGNDEEALAVMQWLRQNYYRVPEDVAVVGYNNSDFTQYAYPPLASIGCSGSELVGALVEQLFQESPSPRQIHVPYRFYWRQSAGLIKI